MRIVRSDRQPDPLSQAMTLAEYKRLNEAAVLKRSVTEQDMGDALLVRSGFATNTNR